MQVNFYDTFTHTNAAWFSLQGVNLSNMSWYSWKSSQISAEVNSKLKWCLIPQFFSKLCTFCFINFHCLSYNTICGKWRLFLIYLFKWSHPEHHLLLLSLSTFSQTDEERKQALQAFTAQAFLGSPQQNISSSGSGASVSAHLSPTTSSELKPKMKRGPRKNQNEKYKLKYLRLRKAARAMIFVSKSTILTTKGYSKRYFVNLRGLLPCSQENAALCDEVAHLEEKFLRAKEERRWVPLSFLSSNAIFFFCTTFTWTPSTNKWFLFFPLFISRFLLKSLLQYQSLSEGEILPTPSSSSLPAAPPVTLTSVPAGASGLPAAHGLISSVSTGEEVLLKKPKKERKERGKENGKEECKYSCRLESGKVDFFLFVFEEDSPFIRMEGENWMTGESTPVFMYYTRG